MKTIADQSFRHGFAARALATLFVLFAFQLSASERRVIEVHTVNQLYAAVNNGANAGAIIHLAPGSYVLSPENDQGEARPNNGSLRLRPGMSLVGSEQRVDRNFDGIPDPVDFAGSENFAVSGTETTIDGSALELPMKVRKDCGSSTTTFPEPVIAVNQNNTVLFLHLVGGTNVTVGEPANPVDPVDSLWMKIEDTVVESSFVAMSFANMGCGRSHARSELIFSGTSFETPTFSAS